MPDALWAQAAPWLSHHAPWVVPLVALMLALAPVLNGASAILEQLRDWRRPKPPAEPDPDPGDPDLAEERAAHDRTRRQLEQALHQLDIADRWRTRDRTD
ncbi:hypothetical protein [Rhizosaccharibacter radicis]|uniref:Envelope stress response membrane protein PspB n=1 Tax=Rhizosaccharibacter radicis TaxID=2782605 RepID=A0ABT1VVZ1_9PROT|nr:hypothetical protein [Acetobacteraceae bacterium KSS12]